MAHPQWGCTESCSHHGRSPWPCPAPAARSREGCILLPLQQQDLTSIPTIVRGGCAVGGSLLWDQGFRQGHWRLRGYTTPQAPVDRADGRAMGATVWGCTGQSCGANAALGPLPHWDALCCWGHARYAPGATAGTSPCLGQELAGGLLPGHQHRCPSPGLAGCRQGLRGARCHPGGVQQRSRCWDEAGTPGRDAERGSRMQPCPGPGAAG